jgi:NAD-dependent SIR2 family protein deacetylase
MEAERNEKYDSEAEIKTKISQVIALLKTSKYVIVYTGAGISTSANIPDFRGPNGVWTARDFGRATPAKAKSISDACPTYAHYAITELVRRKIVHFVISTNMDCLHIRSGLPKHLIIEQHGNCNKEICSKCGREYWRQYDVGDTVVKTREHFTYRFCTWCKGKLQDTIVHFSENYHEENTQPLSVHHAYKADLVIVLGTSMLVQPNASYPEIVLEKPNGNMVIVNLQKTPYDHLSSVRLFCTTDLFMELVMKELNITKFNQEADCRDQWDTITEDELQECLDKGVADLQKRRYLQGSNKEIEESD